MNLFFVHSFIISALLNPLLSLEFCPVHSVTANQPRVGKLVLANNNELLVSAVVGDKDVAFQLDTGASYSQINSHLANVIGLKSHPKLIGVSKIGDRSIKYDFLAVVDLKLNGVGSSLIMKVAPNQPNLFGLDAMFRFGMIIDPVQSSYTQSSLPLSDNDHLFDFIDLERYMSKMGITHDDLIPVKNLPDPSVAYNDLLRAGSANSVMHLGTSFKTIPIINRPALVNLGVGN